MQFKPKDSLLARILSSSGEVCPCSIKTFSESDDVITEGNLLYLKPKDLMLISSKKNTFTETPIIMYDQIPGHHSPACQCIKFTVIDDIIRIVFNKIVVVVTSRVYKNM